MSRECKSHVRMLRQVATKLAYNLTMYSKPIILADKKQMRRLKKAEGLIYDAILLLDFDTKENVL